MGAASPLPEQGLEPGEGAGTPPRSHGGSADLGALTVPIGCSSWGTCSSSDARWVPWERGEASLIRCIHAHGGASVSSDHRR